MALYAHQALRAYVRSWSKQIIEGEKPSRLFCALEKHNSVQKHVPKLLVERNGTEIEITEQKNIEEEIFKYYRELFSEKPVDDTDICEFLSLDSAASCPKLSNDQKDKMEGLITNNR